MSKGYKQEFNKTTPTLPQHTHTHPSSKENKTKQHIKLPFNIWKCIVLIKDVQIKTLRFHF